MSKKSYNYTGSLTPEQAAEGIQIALRNAHALAEEADILLRNDRYARAASLAILAIEEAGKPAIIRSLLLEEDSVRTKSLWRSYRTHTEKNFLGIIQKYMKYPPHIEDYRPLFSRNNELPNTLDFVKQAGFYSDCFGNAYWREPAREFNLAYTQFWVTLARTITGAFTSAITTAPELRLWVKHLKPVWRGEFDAMKNALIDCYNEAHETGVLCGSATPEDMARFLRRT